MVVGQLLMDVFEGPDRTHLPSSALLHAAEEEAELQVGHGDACARVVCVYA